VGGKLVSNQHPLAFVSASEQQARRADVRTFFNPATSQVQRALILSRYRASYLLAPRRSALDSTVVPESEFRALGVVTHEDDHFLLVRLNPRAFASGPR